MGVVARGCHGPDPDTGFGKVGGCVLLSAERGEESAAWSATGIEHLSKGSGEVFVVISDRLPRNRGVKECKY